MKNFNKHILEAVNRGIKLALDDYQDMEPNSSISSDNDVIDSEDVIQKQIDFWNEWVDLGLPSGTLWAKYNLGVNSKKLDKAKDWYGDYYAFGELETKSDYNIDDYKWYDKNKGKFEMLKYNYMAELELDDDIANQIDSKYKIPNKEQFKELLQYTSHQFVQNYNKIYGLNGVVFKSNNAELFLPAAGHYCNEQLCAKGYYGVYWTQNSGNPGNAWNLFFSGNPKDTFMAIEKYYKENRIELSLGDRWQGLTIRPVLNYENQ